MQGGCRGAPEICTPLFDYQGGMIPPWAICLFLNSGLYITYTNYAFLKIKFTKILIRLSNKRWQLIPLTICGFRACIRFVKKISANYLQILYALLIFKCLLYIKKTLLSLFLYRGCAYTKTREVGIRTYQRQINDNLFNLLSALINEN